METTLETADGTRHAVPAARPVTLPAGLLRLGGMGDGLRAWLAVAGGFDVPVVLGSRSTDLRGGFGGLEGRALRAGDLLPIGTLDTGDVAVDDLDAPIAPGWWIDLHADLPPDAPIRYVPSALSDAPALASHDWTVDPRSDRQGLRCAGPAFAADLPEQVSAAVAPGTVQLPPDGRPIVLLADAQTAGGYPRLGHVIATDLPRLAQRRAGDALRVVAVTRDEARAAFAARTARIARLEWAIDLALARKSVP
ncbi:MAG: biotin-dependent carboxyltransferase family protein [Lysobacteraceae bacterium]